MSSATAIRADQLSKNYKLRRERTRTLKETILRQYAPAEQVQALRDVSFSVNSGESFGVVGANGSGKSTLLKLLAGTAKPTTGTLEVNGRVTALLEIGAGFHPDFSGRENAYLNGSLLGLSRKQMDRTMPAIEEFADIGRFFDAAVKTYSSGMYMRLGFAVAVHLEPDIRLVGEKEQRERAARGEIGARWGSKEIEITNARVFGPDGAERVVLESGQPACIEIGYRNPKGVSDAVFGVYIYRDDGIGVFGTNTLIDGVTVPVQPEGIVRFAIQGIELLPGGFDVDIGITDPQDRAYDYHQKGVQFRVIGPSREVGVARLAHRWEFR